MATENIGLIGLGTIGSLYAEQLCRANYPLTVFDIAPEKIKTTVQLGAQPAQSPKDVADKSDIIILSLPNSDIVEQIMTGSDGILEHLRSGQMVIDTGTSRPTTELALARLCAEKGVDFIDSPLTYRASGQILMVGGSAQQYVRAKPVLECLSYKMMHVGEVGRGQVLKLINQAVLAGVLAAQAECIGLAKHHNVDPRLLKDYLEFDIPEALLNEDLIAKGQLGLHYKDLLYLMEMAHESGAHIPLMSLVHEIFKRAHFAGDKRWRQTGIITYWNTLNST